MFGGFFPLAGHLVLTFYERRQTLSFFRLIQNEERVVFEEWIIPFLVDSMGKCGDG